MSFADQLVLWLHIAFAIFTVGPVTLAISSTPRYIRRRDVAVLRYLTRITMIFTIGLLVVFFLGVALGQMKHELTKPWLTSAMTLFVVALVLLLLVIRDQRKAIKALADAPGTATTPADEPAGGALTPADQLAVAEPGAAAQSGTATAVQPATDPALADADAAPARRPPGLAAASVHAASVERGRIVAMGGVVNLIWLAVLALMVWRP
jgi:uncharacterized membrane protein YfcA